jgi:hypothetical protein
MAKQNKLLKNISKKQKAPENSVIMNDANIWGVIAFVVLLGLAVLVRYYIKINPFLILAPFGLIIPLVTSVFGNAIRYMSYGFIAPDIHSSIKTVEPWRRVSLVMNDDELGPKTLTFAIWPLGASSVDWFPIRGGGRHGFAIVPDNPDGRGYVVLDGGIAVVNKAHRYTYDALPNELQNKLREHPNFSPSKSPFLVFIVPPTIAMGEGILEPLTTDFGRKMVGDIGYMLKIYGEDVTHADTSRQRIKQRSYETYNREGKIRNRLPNRIDEEEDEDA